MSSDLEKLTHTLVDYALAAGADAADGIAINATSLSISVRNGGLDNADRSEGTDVGVRVIIGDKQACVSASDTSDASLKSIAERALDMAKVAPDDPFIRQASAEQFAKNWDLEKFDFCDPSPEPAAQDLRDMACDAETAAVSVDGVEQVQAATAGYGKSAMFLTTSQGFGGGYTKTDHGVSCVAVAGEGTGMKRDHDGDVRIYQSDLRSAQEIGQTAGQRAVSALHAQKPPTGQFPVVFDERISSSLIGHILAASNGVSVARGATWLRDKLGTQILPHGLSIVEDPHRPRIKSSRPFDAEGLPTQKRYLVKDGVLQSWTMDLRTAAQLGFDSTASARRGTSAPPSPGTSGVALTQGDKSKTDLIKDMGTGLLVTSLMGSSINGNTGDYSRGASGFWVENGEITYAVHECTIAGNLLDMLHTIVPANDARPYLASVVPSIALEGLTIAGA